MVVRSVIFSYKGPAVKQRLAKYLPSRKTLLHTYRTDRTAKEAVQVVSVQGGRIALCTKKTDGSRGKDLNVP